MKHKLTNNSGFTLLGVILVITVISVLGTSVVGVTLNSVKTSSGERDDQSVFYIAEAALTVKVQEIENTVENVYDDVVDLSKINIDSINSIEQLSALNIKLEEDFYSELNQLLGLDNTNVVTTISTIKFEKLFDKIPTANLIIENSGYSEGRQKYNITSIGEVDNINRKISLELQVKWESPFDLEEGNSELFYPELAVLTKNGISISGNGEVNGDIGVLNSSPNSIKINKEKNVDGNIFVQAGTERTAVADNKELKNIKAFDEAVLFPELPPFPNFPTPKFDEDSISLSGNNDEEIFLNDSINFYNDIIVSGNSTLILNTGNSKDVTKEIVVNKLIMSGNSELIIKGNGNLKIFVKYDIDINSTVNEGGNINQLDVFFLDTHNKYNGRGRSLDIKGDVYGSLYAKDANLKLSGNSGFYGNIFTGGQNVEFTGNNDSYSKLILSPYAHVTLTGNSDIYGAIVADILSITGNGDIYYRTDIPATDGLQIGEKNEIIHNPNNRPSLNKGPVYEE